MKELKIDEKLVDEIESICQMSQKMLYEFLVSQMQEYFSTIDTDGSDNKFLYCKGKSPVLLVAHLDTVFEDDIYGGYGVYDMYDSWYSPKNESEKETALVDPVRGYAKSHRAPSEFRYREAFLHKKDIFYDNRKQVMWSPDGLGADDRAGVFTILKILESGLRPHVLFTTDEETGGSGARQFAKSYHKKVLDYGIKYILEIDRRGISDAVFYGCDNQNFENYILSFGWQKKTGTFSDISIICPQVGIAGVNVSAGYFNEHLEVEHLSLLTLQQNYNIIYEMIEESNEIKKYYRYIPRVYAATPTSSFLKNYFDKIKNVVEKKASSFKRCPICDIMTDTFKHYDTYGEVCTDCYNVLSDTEYEEMNAHDREGTNSTNEGPTEENPKE